MMAGGNPAMQAALLGSAADSLGYSSGGGSGGGLSSILNALEDPWRKSKLDMSEKEHEYLLRQWEREEQRAYASSEADKLGNLLGQIAESQGKNPELSPAQKGLFGLLSSIDQAGGLAAILPVAQDVLKNVGQSMAENTEMTGNQKDFSQLRQTPEFQQVLAGDAPAGLQYLEKYKQLMDAGRPEEAQKLLEIIKAEKNPANVYAVAQAGEQGKAQTAAIVKRYDEMPNSLGQFERVKTDIEGTTSAIDDAINMLADNPKLITGPGAAFRMFPATDARNFSNIIDRIRSNIAQGTIEKLKGLSASGSTGFGALSEKELAVIVEGLGKIDQYSDAESVAKTLKEIKGRLNGMSKSLQDKLQREKGWYERNQKYAPELYDQFSGYLDEITPSQQPQTPAEPKPFSATETATRTREALQGQGIAEGTKRRNRNTGEVQIYSNGQWVAQ